MEYYTATKKNEIVAFAATWMDFSSVQSLSRVQLLVTP